MKKKKWFIPVMVIGFVLGAIVVALGVIASKGMGISKGRYLEAKNGSAMLVLDNSPILMSNRTGRDLFAKLNMGDEILVIHDGIAETYPGKTGVYAVFKLSNGTSGDIPQEVVETLTELGWQEEAQTDENVGESVGNTAKEVVRVGVKPEEVFDIAVSYANWVEGNEIFFGALNRDKLAVNSVQHLPIYKFDTLEELNGFKEFAEEFTLDGGYDEIPSFNETTAKYDETFFAENTLMLVYVSASSGTYRFGVSSVYCDGKYFCIHVEQTNHPEIVTCDMAGWFVTVAVPDDMVSGCAEFDADLNHFE